MRSSRLRSFGKIWGLFWTAAFLLAALPGEADALYRFDGLYGPSGKGSQWMVVTTTTDTAGAPAVTPMDTQANFVDRRDSVYLTNGN